MNDQPVPNHNQTKDQANHQSTGQGHGQASSNDQGMVYQLLAQITSRATGNSGQYWLVCDGPLEYDKMEVLGELLTGDGSLSLNTGHKLSPTGIL